MRYIVLTVLLCVTGCAGTARKDNYDQHRTIDGIMLEEVRHG